MRWPWHWFPKQVETVTVNNTGPGCEVCGDYAMIFLNGQRLLCWGHYVAEMQHQRSPQDTVAGGE